MTIMESTRQEKPKRSIVQRALVAELISRLRRADPGTLARLRRLDPNSPSSDFFRLTVDLFDGEFASVGKGRDDAESRWAIIVQAIALCLGTNPEVTIPKETFGSALALAGIDERRVLQLLEAGPSQIGPLCRRVVHQLVARGELFTFAQLVDLVLAKTDAVRESARRSIARDFYRKSPES